MRKLFVGFAGSVAAALLSMSAMGPAAAQGFPSRPITLIVPAAAGGPTDAVSRLVAESMGRTLGQQIVVENVGGAGGTIGMTPRGEVSRRRLHGDGLAYRAGDRAVALR